MNAIIIIITMSVASLCFRWHSRSILTLIWHDYKRKSKWPSKPRGKKLNMLSRTKHGDRDDPRRWPWWCRSCCFAVTVKRKLQRITVRRWRSPSSTGPRSSSAGLIVNTPRPIINISGKIENSESSSSFRQNHIQPLKTGSMSEFIWSLFF